MSSTLNTVASTHLAKPVTATEEAAYLEIGGEQLYYVLHRARHPVAQMLLPGHYVTERPFAYALWVRWARCLAEHGISALRFDYRGCGESTGEFHKFALSSWLDDCRRLIELLEALQPNAPMVLGGIGLGGLLASQLFQEGLGRAMLLWSPSASGSAALRDTLLRRLAFDMTNPGSGKSKSWSDYEAILQKGESIEAAGYILSPRLWNEAAAMKLAVPSGGRDSGVDALGRPWRLIKLGQAHVPLVPGGGLWQALNPGLRMRLAPLNPDLSEFYNMNAQWIRSALQPSPTS